MTPKITFDSSEPPSIGIAALGTTDEELTGYVRVTRNPVLAMAPDGHAYVGSYWHPATHTVRYTTALAPGLEDSLTQLRAFLHGDGS